jgi:predicted membrane chloride channel (bestrophin family)
MALIPICLIYSFALGYYDEQYQPSTNSTTSNSVEPYIVIAITLAYITGFTLFIYYFTKWYLRKLYGKHLDNLKNLLDELNEN